MTERLDVNALGNWLWEAAYVIRGAVDAPKFKDDILSLIFLTLLHILMTGRVQIHELELPPGIEVEAEAAVGTEASGKAGERRERPRAARTDPKPREPKGNLLLWKDEIPT